jgi:hypothetical protein
MVTANVATRVSRNNQILVKNMGSCLAYLRVR